MYLYAYITPAHLAGHDGGRGGCREVRLKAGQSQHLRPVHAGLLMAIRASFEGSYRVPLKGFWVDMKPA